MAKVYVINNVQAAKCPSADNYSVDKSDYVLAGGFNYSNCKADVTYYVLVNGYEIGAFELTESDVETILGGVYANGIFVGELQYLGKDWDANNAPQGWYWFGAPATISVYYETGSTSGTDSEWTLFKNSYLNKLWNDLIDAVSNIINPVSSPMYIWGPIYFNGPDVAGLDSYVYLHEDRLVTADAVEYSIYNGYGNKVLTGSGYDTELLTVLPNGIYTVVITSYGSTGDSSLIGKKATLGIGPLGYASAKDIHDALLSHFALGRAKPAEDLTSGDYLRGISVMASYYHTGNLDTESDPLTLVQIVSYLSNTDDDKAECPGCNEYFPANELVDGYCSNCRGYKCPVCSEVYSDEESAMSCTMTGDCPGNNPGWGHVCEYCSGDHYEEDCPNYCSYCNIAYCDCVTSWCSQEERDTKWHCIDATSDQYQCNNCGWTKTIW